MATYSSRVFKASSQCSASPDGRMVATLLTSTIHVRSTETLQTVASVKVSPSIAGPVSTFLWSSSSSRILLAAADQIQIFSVPEAALYATVRNPIPSVDGKPTLIRFGARDTEVLVYSPFGLKLAIFNLDTSGAVEVANPKFYGPASAGRGAAFRPDSAHLAFLTRSGGKDLVSIHHPVTREVERSWLPDCVDVQGIMWSPDGHWLLVWESSAYGHRLLLYTPDGQLFRSIGAKNLFSDGDADLEQGIRLCHVSPDAAWCALCDQSRRVVVLRTNSWATAMELSHPTTIVPRDTVQVWQEQVSSTGDQTTRSFIRSSQSISPQTRNPDAKHSSEVKKGCSLALFDASSALMVTRLDDSPSTLWIWDIAASELRAVLLFHSTVTADWHPSKNELLLVTCLDESHQSVSFVWDPLSDGPTPICMDNRLRGAPATKPRISWVNLDIDTPLLLLANEKNYALLSLSEAAQGPASWQHAETGEWTTHSLEDVSFGGDIVGAVDDDSMLEDTFSFRNP